MAVVLLFSVFIIATCGLVYELIAGALASYLLGDSITQFSTVIGVYLFSMGIGSYFSKFVNKNLISVFINVELLVGLVGGFSAALLFVSFEYLTYFRVLLYFTVMVTGTLVGLEIPLLMRILQSQFEFKELVSKVFTFDYVGALFASLLFPLFLVPHLGLIKTAFLFGVLNVLVAIWALYLFNDEVVWARLMKGSAFAVLIALIVGFVYSDKILNFSEESSYHDKVIFSKNSKYQRIVLTKSNEDLRLFLNGNLQFSSKDEYRYHEALVHVGFSALPQAKKILILGGGDGLAAREVLKYSSVEKITLVDLDPLMTELFKTNTLLTPLNKDSLNHSKVQVINDDAFLWLKNSSEKYDFIIIDFPDPSNFSVGKLYTNSFYREVKKKLAPKGLIVVQSTSPFVAKKSFWCVDNTIKSVGLKTFPYHVYVPAFGDWGYILASEEVPEFKEQNLASGLKFINYEVLKSLFIFPEDIRVSIQEVNKLNNQILVRYFEQEWSSL